MRSRSSLAGAVLMACVLPVALCGCSVLAAPFNYVGDQFRHDTIVTYTVRDADTQAGIIGARIELFALQTGLDPRFDDSFETTADALLTTSDRGEATLNVKPTPNEPRDDTIRPSTLYRSVISAPGFQTVTTALSPYNEGMGTSPKTVDLERAM